MPSSSADRFYRICLGQIAAGRIAWVIEQRDFALARIAAGAGELVTISTGSANGKTATGEIQLSALEVADLAQDALDTAAANDSANISTTSLDFSCLD
jgi:hypothetical protein